MHVKYYDLPAFPLLLQLFNHRIFVDLVGLLTRKNIVIRDWAIFTGDMGPVQNGMGQKDFHSPTRTWEASVV